MKIRFVSKMMKFQRLLREENEKIVKLKGMTPDNKLPASLLLTDGLESAFDKFQAAQKADQKNEKMPSHIKKTLSK